MSYFEVIWNEEPGGNVEHIAEHGLIYERSGIDRAALSRLENNEDANPTLVTLERYAEAVGKQMIVLLAEPTL